MFNDEPDNYETVVTELGYELRCRHCHATDTESPAYFRNHAEDCIHATDKKLTNTALLDFNETALP